MVLEVTKIVGRHFLGVPYVTVSAHSRHMQQSCNPGELLKRGDRCKATRNGQEVEADCVTENRPMEAEVNQSLERTLECAVIVSWADFTHDSQTGLIHVEYGFAPTGTLDYLKIWSSLTRGHWLLACEYWMSENTFHGAGVRSTTDTNRKACRIFWNA